MVIFGIIIVSIAAFFGFREYQIITNGEKVSATVSRVIESSGDNGAMYQPEFTYVLNGVVQTHRFNVRSSSTKYVVGDPEILIISERGITKTGIHNGIIAMAVAAIFGLLFIIIGVIWIVRRRKHFDEIARLKQTGRRVQARFIRKEKTNTAINDQYGTILYFQGEGSNRKYNTKPIYSEFSIQWLEEHVFDVYIDRYDHSKYYVDIEKHFGHPVSHS